MGSPSMQSNVLQGGTSPFCLPDSGKTPARKNQIEYAHAHSSASTQNNQFKGIARKQPYGARESAETE